MNIIVLILDSVMGSGKTNLIIKRLSNLNRPFIICVERQTEVDRLAEGITGAVALSDLKKDNPNKSMLELLKDCLAKRQSIISTHQLMALWDNAVKVYVQEYGYELYLDEVLSGIFEPMPLSKRDVTELIDEGKLVVNTQGRLDKVEVAKSFLDDYRKREQKIRNKDCYLSSAGALIEAPKPDFLTSFKKVTVLTYMFENSLMWSYFRLHDIDYELRSVVAEEPVAYKNPDGSEFVDLINIYDEGKHNGKKVNTSYSKSWYERGTNRKTAEKQLRQVAEQHGVSKEFIAYTVHGQFRDKFHHPSFADKVTNKKYHGNRKGELSEEELRRVTFLPQNMRGTNDFSHKTFMAYMCDTYMQTPVFNLLCGSCLFDKEEIKKIKDNYALSQLIQWLWRGCIRNGEPMTVYIPSKRMRNLLKEWLGLPTER